ncbi:unnamed protein product [Leptidea sinapis]|uniref:Cathepsin propeptide inhibitor domain-containing protein n=1 Tax=Leptidea sinapis TaxID=189913 RepID=A0A5E4QXN8_9NEOP|nr:unnamed protein product [Leptidea sinapis]
MPYYEVSDTKNAEYAGRQRNMEINSTELFDLDKAPQLYQNFMKKYNKKNATKKLDRRIHYLRFVKTLVEINKNHFQSSKSKELDANADIVQSPFEYFY